MKNKKNWQTSKLERSAYYMYFVGQNILYIVVTGFIALFLMNRGIKEAAIAGILLAPKIWDAINDPLFGIIVDKAHMKSGRFLPWLRISWILIPLFTIFIFAMPDTISYTGKVCWAFFGYIFWSMSYTVCDAPIFALSTAMSTHIEERTEILSIGRLFATVTCVVITLVVEGIYVSIGWFILSVVLSGIAMLTMFPILVLGKERSQVTNSNAVSIPDMFKLIVKNKYLLVYIIAFFLVASTMSVEVLIPIFAQYVLGSSSTGTVLLGICILPMIIIAGIIPSLSQKVDKMTLFMISIGFYALSSIIQYFTNYQNEIVLYITTFFRAVGYGGYSILIYMFIPNIMEYGHFITGERQEGVYFALQTFMTKLTGAIVSSSTMIILAWFGFSSANADSVTGVVDAMAGHGFWIVFTLVSALGSILALPLLWKGYQLKDKDADLMSRCNSNEISREECIKRLSREYE